jgi:hypothetical protein
MRRLFRFDTSAFLIKLPRSLIRGLVGEERCDSCAARLADMINSTTLINSSGDYL